MKQIENTLNKYLLVVLVFLGLVWVGSAHAQEAKIIVATEKFPMQLGTFSQPIFVNGDEKGKLEEEKTVEISVPAGEITLKFGATFSLNPLANAKKTFVAEAGKTYRLNVVPNSAGGNLAALIPIVGVAVAGTEAISGSSAPEPFFSSSIYKVYLAN